MIASGLIAASLAACNVQGEYGARSAHGGSVARPEAPQHDVGNTGPAGSHIPATASKGSRASDTTPGVEPGPDGVPLSAPGPNSGVGRRASEPAPIKRPGPVPADQWTPYAKLWLARAMVAEAGWLAELDHVLIAWAIVRQWRARLHRWPELRFADQVRAACAGLGVASTARHEWLHALPPPLASTPLAELEPAGWPAKVSWRRHSVWWAQVLRRVQRFGEGRLRDPSRGRVMYWGARDESLPDPARAAMAVNRGDWVELDFDTRNRFFARAHGDN